MVGKKLYETIYADGRVTVEQYSPIWFEGTQ